MKTLKKIVLLCLFVFCLPALAGVWTSGGGNGVVYPDGSFRFLDLVPASELPQSVPDEVRLDTLDKIGRGSRKELWDFENFSTLATGEISKWRKFEPEFIDDLIYRVQFVRPAFIRSAELAEKLKALPLDQTLASPSAPASVQVPVAIFIAQQVVFLAGTFDLLSPRDRLAAVVHEALRQYNFAIDNNVQNNFDTKDIEEATRILLSTPTREGAKKLMKILGYEKNEEQKKILKAETEKIQSLIKEMARLAATNQNSAHVSADNLVPELDATIAHIEEVQNSVRLNPLSIKEIMNYYHNVDSMITAFLLDNELNQAHQAMKKSFVNAYVQSRDMYYNSLADGLASNDHIITGMQLDLCLITPRECQ